MQYLKAQEPVRRFEFDTVQAANANLMNQLESVRQEFTTSAGRVLALEVELEETKLKLASSKSSTRR